MPSVKVGSGNPKPKCKRCLKNDCKTIGMNMTKTARRYRSICGHCMRELKKLKKQPAI